MGKFRTNELTHLINDYLCINPTINHFGYHTISKESLELALHNLKPFERPDMYAVLHDKIVAIEHFEFDASKRTRKGMNGKMEEALLKQRLNNASSNDTIFIDKGDYQISLQDWMSNFNECFDSHYQRIPEYKNAIRHHLKREDTKQIIIGFFIENQFSPIVYDGKKVAELYYFDTLQFSNKLLNSDLLDFVLFGSNYEGRPQIFYLDKNHFYNSEKLIDLTDTSLR